MAISLVEVLLDEIVAVTSSRWPRVVTTKAAAPAADAAAAAATTTATAAAAATGRHFRFQFLSLIFYADQLSLSLS